ncbi:hypothetical protein [Variovorax terrae]|uniref:Acid shock protein n=1 Tax=Variovorax terrae TaxID=2923278 RepID=A0A9X1VWH8_9BURK|nr:hypothetical protein [Variovorax terrae]MCJ0764697.1 hypothetical protein [Variovorax terrae]
MKKLLCAVLSAAVLAVPLAVIPSTASAKAQTHAHSKKKGTHAKKGKKAKKAKSKARTASHTKH